MIRPQGLPARLGAALLLAGMWFGSAEANPDIWKIEWPNTDFTKTSIDLAEILSGGPPKDGIPAIDAPKYVPVAEFKDMADSEPVVGVVLNGEARAYPLSVLIWHEIANDTLGGVPISVTFCPLCNTSLVFDRRVEGRVLDFGTTGKLRNSDLVMYDRQTESWWQQFLGEAIVGELVGTRLKTVPARVESLANFRARAPGGTVLVPTNPYARRYGMNPYTGYDSRPRPYPFFRGPLPRDIAPLKRVVSLGARGAWSLDLVRAKGEIRLDDGIVLRWTKGQNSALDSAVIADGEDVGNVTVQRETTAGPEDVVYGVDFAFAYFAFYPDSPIHIE